MNKLLVILFIHMLSIAIYAQTADDFKTAAYNGDAYAQYGLGWCYANGRGVTQDDSQAFFWYKKAAEGNEPNAQYVLGLCYKDGVATTKNYFEAFSWFKKAAEQGNEKACRELFFLYSDGLGTVKDTIEAQKYLIMAADKNDIKALQWLAFKTQDAEKRILYLQKASDLGDVVSTLQLAYFYQRGIYVRQDIEKAKKLLQPLIERGDENAIRMINDPCFGLEKTDKMNNNTFALIISNTECENYLNDYSFSSDATNFKDFCEMIFGIPEKHIHRVVSPTISGLIKELDWLSNVMDAYDGDANVIIYYAGPGVSDESTLESYILPTDGDASDPSSGLSLNELYEILSKMPSKSVLVFIDACFNGARRNGEMLTSARGIKIKAKPAFPTGNIVVFNASQKDETAWELSEQRRGLFTSALLYAIKEDQGDLTLGEIAQKVISNVKKTAVVERGVSQTPNILASPELGDKWMNWKLKP